MNPSKVRGVVSAFQSYSPVSDVRAVKVETGLPPQPIGLDVIVRGAELRARLAMSGDCDFSTGIEAGFYRFGSTYFDIEAAYVISRELGESLGFFPSFPVPTWFVDEILSGRFRELEEIVDNLYKTENIGEKIGFISLLTRHVVVRSELSRLTTLMVLTKILNRELYEKSALR
ncbi:inosine/xanthosine triphosphatase [Desulfurococcus amylolyticus]|uniref:inosine/xanthosine triphosphatase n=1 Tax=Desulfurococcus amylolyticus TaxID=94694 RepID=UPI0022B29665|nr:inosine/xanthosine triphosphatase [Desulfurococcus amylolyticus]